MYSTATQALCQFSLCQSGGKTTKRKTTIYLPISPIACTLSDFVESAHSIHFLPVKAIRRIRGGSRVRRYSCFTQTSEDTYESSFV